MRNCCAFSKNLPTFYKNLQTNYKNLPIFYKDLLNTSIIASSPPAVSDRAFLSPHFQHFQQMGNSLSASLLLAVRSGNVNGVNQLVDQGVDINTIFEDEKTVLHVAAEEGIHFVQII